MKGIEQNNVIAHTPLEVDKCPRAYARDYFMGHITHMSHHAQLRSAMRLRSPSHCVVALTSQPF